jgi:uncharacterized protein YukE
MLGRFACATIFGLFPIICSVSEARAALPQLPAAPALGASQYPTCQTEWRGLSKRADKYDSVQSCINALENFNLFYLNRFPAKISQYTTALLGLEKDFKTSSATLTEKQTFTKEVSSEINKCRSLTNGDYGDYYQDYYLNLQRYRQDSALLLKIRERLRFSQG